ncbi:calponin homology domain-containing protein DDB_G0272472 [Phlebotomus argentipes]|uniref:calponin homology domain-containing protein DDB_G0272472 n=1 Tax=Phlebotomus argentipes TaxID=94469 RepID=UPI002892FF46|nr:calponin homology domain-containing protein DDB_G0272472 [Phlebotomus argentipes]
MDELVNKVGSFVGMVTESRKERLAMIAHFTREMEKKYLENLPAQMQSKKKRVAQDDQDKENESSEKIAESSNSQPARKDEFAMPEPVAPLRPVRTAKVNASKNLKEPDLGTKMRQPGSNEMLVAVKEEPADEPVVVKRETRTKKKQKKAQTELAPPEVPQEEARNSNSVELIPPKEPDLVEVASDEEMPPPALPAPKNRRGRPKKKASVNVVERPVRESKIKKEKLSVTPALPEAPVPDSSSRKASGESQYEDALAEAPAEQPVEHPLEMNATFDIAPANAEAEKMPENNNSLMTEDNSIEVPAEEPKKASLRKPHPHELFNPCVQSPMRSKVEAFERHAAASAGLRSGTRTPLGTPSHGGHPVLQKAASTSKLAHIVTGAKKKTKSNAPASAGKVTRSTSAEDTKRALNPLLLVAEEKRKKREERHKLAQQAREEKEREKQERHRRMMLEQQEREEKIRQERRKAAKIKQQQELEQRKRLEELQKAQSGKGATAKALKYGFEMLCSDDSTDDEGKSSAKRPTPPLWSVRPHRDELVAIQELLPPKIADTLFMAAPMTPNLKEIFPSIDPKDLHRNSSAVWKTPPRFSDLPK